MQFLKRSVDKGVLEQILNSFTDLTDINVSVFGVQGEGIAGSKNMCSFCSKIREHPEFSEGCKTCDREAFRKSEAKKGLHLYKCHMKLWEAAIPIIIQNNVAGFMMLGQVKGSDEDHDNDKEFVFAKLRDKFSGDTLQEIEKKYEAIIAMDINKIQSAAKMLEIITSYIANTEIIHVYDMEAVEKAKEYIDSNLCKTISTSTVAKAIQHNASYLSTLFSRDMGMTVTEYIEQQRIVIAKQLLTLTSKNIKEIACEIGYMDQNYFSRVFKKHIGLSPSTFRNKYKKLC